MYLSPYKLSFSYQACQISRFRPEITGFFIALPAVRLSCENLQQNHKISGISFWTTFWNSQIKLTDFNVNYEVILLLGKQINSRSRLQKTTDRLITVGVKQINPLGVNIWCDNKLQILRVQITSFSIVEAYKKSLVRKMKQKKGMLVENF